jgi:hypothetical protein
MSLAVLALRIIVKWNWLAAVDPAWFKCHFVSFLPIWYLLSWFLVAYEYFHAHVFVEALKRLHALRQCFSGSWFFAKMAIWVDWAFGIPLADYIDDCAVARRLSWVCIFNEISDFTSFGKFEQFFFALFRQNYFIIDLKTLSKTANFGQLRFLGMERVQKWLKLWFCNCRLLFFVLCQ